MARWVPSLALAVSIATMVCLVAGVVLGAMNGWPRGLKSWDLGGTVVVGALGTLVTLRRPSNTIGWLLSGMALLDAIGALAPEYGFYGSISHPGSLPFAGAFGTVAYGVGVGGFFGLMITFLLLLFPDGRLPSRRWWPVALVACVGVAAMTVGLAWGAYGVGMEALMANLGAEGLVLEGPALWLNNGGHLLTFAVFPLAVVSLFVRRRRAGAVQRQQLRWFAYGAAVFMSSIVAASLTFLPEWLLYVYEMGAGYFLFTSIGIAILRYRLYDIDRIVSRTVGYVVVVAVLVGVYILVVFLLSSVLPFEGRLAAAASTLAVAGMFNPLRKRVRDVVDRRFNRARFDAANIVQTFTQRLRDEVDLLELRDELGAAAGSTMQPSHLSLWLREKT